jgi:hypothetical protein
MRYVAGEGAGGVAVQTFPLLFQPTPSGQPKTLPRTKHMPPARPPYTFPSCSKRCNKKATE